MDLPGIIPSSVDPVKKQTVEKIVQYYARDPNYSLIVVLKCTEHHETLGDIALLDDLMKLDLTADFPSPRNNWKKESVMIVNRINSIMPDRAVFPNIKETQKWFMDQQKDGPRFFVALKPDNNFIRETASDDLVKEFLKDFDRKEKKLFDDFKRDVTSNSPVTDRWRDSIDDLFTVKNAKNSISSLWMKSFANSLPTLIHEIESLLYNAKNEKIKIAEKIERLDPHKYGFCE